MSVYNLNQVSSSFFFVFKYISLQLYSNVYPSLTEKDNPPNSPPLNLNQGKPMIYKYIECLFLVKVHPIDIGSFHYFPWFRGYLSLTLFALSTHDLLSTKKYLRFDKRWYGSTVGSNDLPKFECIHVVEVSDILHGQRVVHYWPKQW